MVSVIKSASQRASGMVTICHLSLGGVCPKNLRPNLARTLGGLLGPPEDPNTTLLGLEAHLCDPPPHPEKSPRHLDKFPPNRLFGEPLGLDTPI